MKYYKKKLYGSLLVIFLFTFFMSSSVSANSISSLTYNQLGISNFQLVNQNTWNVEFNTTHSWNNWGDSTLVFSFAQQCLDGGGNNVCIQGGILPPVVGVAMTTNDTYACELGTTTSYTDSSVLYNLYTVKCRGNFGSNGLTKLTFTLQGVPYVWALHFGSYFTVIQNGNDNSDIISAIQQNNNSQAISDINANISSSINALAGTISSEGSSTRSAIESGNQQAHEDSQQIHGDITSDNTSGAESSANDFVNNSAFQDNTGLNAIISLPLNMINNLSNTCSPINLHVPYLDFDITLPCFSSVLNNKVPTIYNLLKIIINGFIIYRILLDIFFIVKHAKDPDDDRIEVLDL